MQQQVPDEMASEMLHQLEAMRQADPTQYAELMELLQQATTSTSGGTGPEMKSMNAGDIAAAVSQLRSDGQAMDSINLPGGQASLTSEGVKLQSKGIRITPQPGFVVKTRLQSQNTKIFINVCKHEQLGEPATKKKLDDDGNEVEGLNIPISLGPERTVEDKAGMSSKVFDVVVNPKVVQDCIEDATGAFRDFVCHLAIQYIEQKYKLSLQSQYKLPKMTYKGDKIEDQYIQDRSQVPKIEEVSRPMASSVKKGAKPKPAPKQVATKSLDFSINWVSRNGDVDPLPDEALNGDPVLVLNEGVTALQFSAVIECDTLHQVTVKASAFKLTVCVEGYRPYSTLLPYCILPPKTFAQLADDNELRVTCILDLTPFEEGPDPGSNQWLLREAIRQETAALQQHDTVESSHPQNVEDIFHLKAATDDRRLHQTTSPMESVLDELPEDRFHAKDILSQHIIQQREQSVQQKREDYEKEKQELKQDPNVEYVDFTAEKSTPANVEAVDLSDTERAMKEKGLHDASTTIANRVLQRDRELAEAQAIHLSSLSSSTWTELLD